MATLTTNLLTGEQYLLNINLPVSGSSIIETDPTVPSYIKSISQADINEWNSKQPAGDYILTPIFTGHTNDLTIHFPQSGITITENQVTNLVSDLANRSLTGHTHNGTYQPAGDYVLTPTFTGHTKDLTIHFPQSGITITENQVTSLVNDLANRSLTGHTHTGIYQPAGSYLVAADIIGKENTSNKVTGLTSGSTNTQYPTAKLVYDQLATKQQTGAYLTSFTEVDPTVPSYIKNITTDDITNWNLSANAVIGDIYVSTTGSDSNLGTKDSPYYTIQKGLDMAVAGDIIIVKDGRYSTTGTTQLVISWGKTGTTLNPIIIKAEHKYGAILDGQNNLTANCFDLGHASSYLVVDGFEITGFQHAAALLIESSDNITIKNCKIHAIGKRCTDSDSGQEAIYLNTCTNLFIDSNIIYDIGRFALGESGCTPTTTYYKNHDHGIYFSSNVSGCTVSNNLIYDCTAGWCIQFYNGSSANVNNVSIIDNTFADPNPYKVGHIILSQGHYINLLIANNIFYNPLSNGITIDGYGTAESSNIKNNITFGGTISDATLSGITFTNNFNNTNPLFINASIRNYNLQSTSPAINAGITVGVTTDYNGNTRLTNDIGAFGYNVINSSILNPNQVNAVEQISVAAVDITGKMNLNQTSRQTIINGAPLFNEGLRLGTNPTGTTFEEGKIYYDAFNKTLGICIDTDVTIQLGQEELILCYNNTGVDIPNGMVVYPTGANGDMPTIALAIANNTVLGTFLDIGMTTQIIPNGKSGFVTNRGIVHNLDTSAYNAGDTLYLSPTVLGGVTKIPTTNLTDYLIKVGVALIISPTGGSIYIRQILNNRIVDLADIAIDTPIVDQTLAWNGLKWINKSNSAISAGVGNTFYLDDTPILTGGTQSDSIHTLSKTPITTTEIVDQATLVTGNLTQVLDRYMYDTALGGTQIDGGMWTFNTYCYVNNSGGVTTIPVTVRKSVIGTGTVTITGTGTSRTATVTGGTPFIAGDANASLLLSSLLRTPNAVFKITAFTSSTVVTVTTLSTYVNESNVSYYNHKFLFTDNIVDINQTAVGLITMNSFQPAFSINATDKLAITYYAQSDTNNRTVYLYHNGTTHLTSFTTPLVTRHNDLAGIQGGSSTERYHVSSNTASLLSSLTSTSDELNTLHNTSLTATELGYVHGVTSAIQTQILAKLGKVRTTYNFTSGTTLTSTHAGAIIECDGTFTITLGNATQTGTVIDIINVGTGVITIAATTTVNAKAGALKLATQWTQASAYQRGSNVWIVYGDLTS